MVFLVVDTDPVLPSVLRELSSSAGHEVELFERLEALFERLTPIDRGCVVLGMRMPGWSRLELRAALRERGITLPLIFMTDNHEVLAAIMAMKRGAVEFLPTPVEPSEMLTTIERALRMDAEAASERAARDDARGRWAELSPRERDVCYLTARGLLIKQVAAELGTVVSTVHRQRTCAFKKLGVHSLVELSRLIARLDDETS